MPRSRLLLLLIIFVMQTNCTFAQEPTADADPPPNPFPKAIEIPEGILDGGSAWFNTAGPLSLKDLRGKIVLLDFWTYCCINCIHVLPDLKYLEEKYGDQIVVIGVHSAKFDNEKIDGSIREAIMRYEIEHPVVNDDSMLIWQKFGTRAWPTLALVDPEGRYIGSQSGEGNRELFEQSIERLIKYHRWKGTLDETPLRFELEEFSRPETALRYPGKILFDPKMNRLFIADTGHNRIVVCTDSGEFLHTIGSGRIGRADGTFESASFDHPQGLALQDQRLYVADTENHLLRMVDLEAREVTTLAGTGKQGRPGPLTRGRITETPLNSPWDLEITDSTLYVAMAGPHQIWSHEIGTDKIGVFAGSAREDVLNGRLADAAFAQPSDIVANEAGTTLYVADSEGSSIRKIVTGPSRQFVSTIAGTSELPRGQSLFAFGDVDGIGAAARFQHPLGLAIDGSTLFVADSYNHRIRTVDLNSAQVAAYLGTGRAGDGLQPLQFNEPAGLAISDQHLWIADTNNHRIVTVDRTTMSAASLALDGLTPPAPVGPEAVKSTNEAIQLSPFVVGVPDELRVVAQLNVPDGYKWNDLAPITWEVFALTGEDLVQESALGVRDEADFVETQAAFMLPLTGTPGTATYLIRMSYGFCSDDSSVCRLASAEWEVSIEANEESEVAEIEISFPDQTARKLNP